jgi:hypothetical protein
VTGIDTGRTETFLQPGDTKVALTDLVGFRIILRGFKGAGIDTCPAAVTAVAVNHNDAVPPLAVSPVGANPKTFRAFTMVAG